MSARPFLTACVAALLACSSSTSTSSSSASSSSGSSGAAIPPGDQPAATTLFTKAVTEVTIEIDYAPGAEPFQGEIKKFGDPWSLLSTNVSAIFDGNKKTNVPKTIAQMEKLEDVTATTFTNADIAAVAAAHRTEKQYSNAVSFYVVLLNGTFVDDAGAAQPDLVATTVGKTGIVALFKPVIKNALVEQLAFIHQLGHAVGFVDNGVPVGDANRAHVDAIDGHHCTNAACAMSFSLERAAGAEAYAASNIKSPQAILIGQECLSDARILENAQ